MTVFFLIRHALHSLGGETLAGRLPDVHLSPKGRHQAESLAARLAAVPLKALYSSPMERTQETARAIGATTGLTPQISPEITELDFGDWMGQKIADLRPDEKWKQFNAFRSGTRAPNGELMLETQLRIIGFMTQLRERHPNEAIALVSHADVIKSAVAYCLGVPIDFMSRIEISPASVTVVAVADYGPWVLCVNNTGELPELPL